MLDRWRIFAHDGSDYADLRKDMLFGFHSYGSQFRGSTPRTPILGA